MKKVSVAVGVAASLLPFVALAQNVTAPNYGYITGILTQVTSILGLLTPIIFAIAILYFFWGLAKFIMAAGDDDARAAGKKIMLWGVVALFVMTSVYGLVKLLGNVVGVGQGGSITLPAIPQSTNTGGGGVTPP
jgi:uncharacterized membrane protein